MTFLVRVVVLPITIYWPRDSHKGRIHHARRLQKFPIVKPFAEVKLQVTGHRTLRQSNIPQAAGSPTILGFQRHEEEMSSDWSDEGSSCFQRGGR